MQTLYSIRKMELYIDSIPHVDANNLSKVNKNIFSLFNKEQYNHLLVYSIYIKIMFNIKRYIKYLIAR